MSNEDRSSPAGQDDMETWQVFGADQHVSICQAGSISGRSWNLQLRRSFGRLHMGGALRESVSFACQPAVRLDVREPTSWQQLAAVGTSWQPPRVRHRTAVCCLPSSRPFGAATASCQPQPQASHANATPRHATLSDIAVCNWVS